MATAYQYTAGGYYAGQIEDYGLLPSNATHVAPPTEKGFVFRWDGKKWIKIEDHKGRQGFVAGQPYTVEEYGPLPEGWSETPPQPTLAEAAQKKMQDIDAETSASILEGFDYTVNAVCYHFSYDRFDQQNFSDAANVALAVKAGTAGLPQTVLWNGYAGWTQGGGGTLVRLEFNADEFLALYFGGALAHKSAKMDAGGARKAALEAALKNGVSVQEIEAL